MSQYVIVCSHRWQQDFIWGPNKHKKMYTILKATHISIKWIMDSGCNEFIRESSSCFALFLLSLSLGWIFSVRCTDYPLSKFLSAEFLSQYWIGFIAMDIFIFYLYTFPIHPLSHRWSVDLLWWGDFCCIFIDIINWSAITHLFVIYFSFTAQITLNLN